MTNELLRDALLSRRRFLERTAWVGAVASTTGTGLGAAKSPTTSSVEQVAESPRPIVEPVTAADANGATRMLGLDHSEAEIEQLLPRLNRQRNDAEAMRALSAPFELSPSETFDAFACANIPTPKTDTTVSGWDPMATAPARVETEAEAAIAFRPIRELAGMLRRGETTSRALTEASLRRLRRLHKTLHCVVTFLDELALAAADRADLELRDGKDRGVLHGIPYGAKDLFAHPAAVTTFGAEPFRDQVWPIQATVLQKLNEAGAVLVAKLSLGALAMGDVWFGGKTRNPWNQDQGSSGSSAGSACAVAAGCVPFALGTETLGSIVSPSVRCGVTGLRPTFGAVSRFGAMPLSWSMDKVGPLAREVTDCAIVYGAIRGADGRDPSARSLPFSAATPGAIKELRIGIAQGPGLETAFKSGPGKAMVDALADSGATVHPVTIPSAHPAALFSLHAEAATAFDDLARAGGLRELTAQGDGSWPNSMRTARLLSAVDVLRASRLRRQLCVDTHAAVAGFDVILTPTHRGSALVTTNLTGHPMLVLPAGDGGQGSGGRPSSFAIVGSLGGEAALCQLGAWWQEQTAFHQRHPKAVD